MPGYKRMLESVAVTAAFALVLPGCSEVPTGTTPIDVEARLGNKGKGGGGGGGGGEEPVLYDVTVNAVSGAGVYTDVADAYDAPDHTTTRVRLQPQCGTAGRDVHLILPDLPDGTEIDPADVPTCNDPGWVFLQLPDVMDDLGDIPQPWPNEPQVNWNRKKTKVLGYNFGVTVHFFFSDLENGVQHDFVFQNATLTEDPDDGSRRVTAHTAHLWINQARVEDPPNEPVVFDLELDVTVQVHP